MTRLLIATQRDEDGTLIVAKQRHGSTGNVPLQFQSDITKFTSPNFKDYSDYGME